MLILILITYIYSYDFTKLKDLKVLEEYKGNSYYTIVLVNSGSFNQKYDVRLNYEIFNTTNSLIENINLKNIFISSLDIKPYNFNYLKSEIEARVDLGKNYTKKELKKIDRAFNKELKKINKLLKKESNNEEKKRYYEQLYSLKEDLNTLMHIKNNNNKKLASKFNFIELLLCNNLNNDLNFVNLDLREDRYIFTYLLDILYFLSIFDYEPHVFYDLFIEYSDSKLKDYQDLYRNSEINAQDYNGFYNIYEIELATIKSIFSTFNEYGLNSIDDLFTVSYMYFLSTAEEILNNFIEQIKNYKNINTYNYVQLVVNNLFIAPGNRSLPSLLKDNKISYVLLSPKSAVYFEDKILNIESLN